MRPSKGVYILYIGKGNQFPRWNRNSIEVRDGRHIDKESEKIAATLMGAASLRRKANKETHEKRILPNIKLKLGTPDTVRVRDTIDILDVASSSESGR